MKQNSILKRIEGKNVTQEYKKNSLKVFHYKHNKSIQKLFIKEKKNENEIDVKLCIIWLFQLEYDSKIENSKEYF